MHTGKYQHPSSRQRASPTSLTRQVGFRAREIPQNMVIVLPFVPARTNDPIIVLAGWDVIHGVEIVVVTAWRPGGCVIRLRALSAGASIWNDPAE